MMHSRKLDLTLAVNINPLATTHSTAVTCFQDLAYSESVPKPFSRHARVPPMMLRTLR